MNRNQTISDYRFSLAAAREIRTRPGVATAIRYGVSELDRKLAWLEPDKFPVTKARDLYFAMMRRAADRREILRHHPGGPWTSIGRTDEGNVVYAASAGTMP